MLQQIVIKTQNSETMRPLLRSALQRELKLLEQGLRRTHTHLVAFEKQYNMSTDEFLRRFNKDDLGETLDFIDWYGETKMMASLREQKKAIEGTVVA
jgi:type II secretory pathway predicted ATPase ExeA